MRGRAHRLAVVTSRATSLMNVARDIAYVAKAKGVTPVLLDYAVNPYDLYRMAGYAIVVMTVNPLVSRSWLLISRDYNRLGIPSYVYATVEGRLPRIYMRDWIREEVLYVANSRYTARMLREAGIEPLDTVPHGINFEEVEAARRLRDVMRRQIEERVGKGIIFGTVAANHPRKGLRLLAQAIRIVAQRTKEARFYIVSTETAKTVFAGAPSTYVDTEFGKRSRAESLAVIAAFDFLVHPALAEGFGLPVLEAMALGVTPIHAAYEPLTEFSTEETSILVPVERIDYDSFGEGIDYELHVYSPKAMADAITEAVDLYRNARSALEDKKAKAYQVARKHDIVRLYPRLLELLHEVEKQIT